MEYETVRTERAGHAHKMIQTVDPRHYSGVVTVSGDGLVHEVCAQNSGVHIFPKETVPRDFCPPLVFAN